MTRSGFGRILAAGRGLLRGRQEGSAGTDAEAAAADQTAHLQRLARAAERALRWDEALAHWRDLAERLPDKPEPRVRHVRALLELGRLEEAWETLGAALGHWPDHPGLNDLRGQILENEQNWSEALQCWRALAKSHPSYKTVGVGQHRALCELKLGRMGEARQTLREHLGADEEAAALRRLLGPHAAYIPLYGRKIEDAFRE